MLRHLTRLWRYWMARERLDRKRAERRYQALSPQEREALRREEDAWWQAIR